MANPQHVPDYWQGKSPSPKPDFMTIDYTGASEAEQPAPQASIGHIDLPPEAVIADASE